MLGIYKCPGTLDQTKQALHDLTKASMDILSSLTAITRHGVTKKESQEDYAYRKSL